MTKIGIKRSKVGTVTLHDGKYNVWARLKAGPDTLNDHGYTIASFGVTVHKPRRREADIWAHEIPDDVEPIGDWTPELVAEYNAMSGRWHMNAMRAGSPRQEEFLRANPPQFKYPDTHYDTAKRMLAEAGLDPDTECLYVDRAQPCDTCGLTGRAHLDSNRRHAADHPFINAHPYKYGHAWLKEELGPDFWDFLDRMPGNATTVMPGDNE